MDRFAPVVAFLKAAGPAHPPRPHPGDERRELPPQAQPGERPLPALRRTGRRLAHTDAVPSRSQNSGYFTCLRPPVIGQVVHDSSASVAQLLGAIDTQLRPKTKIHPYRWLRLTTNLAKIGLAVPTPSMESRKWPASVPVTRSLWAALRRNRLTNSTSFNSSP